jgi:putative two-component system response regulator
MPYEPEEMLARIQNQLRARRDQSRLQATIRELEIHTQSLRNELAQTQARLSAETLENERISLSVLTALERANRHNDDDRGNHVRRVAACSAFLATLHGCTPEFVCRLRRAAPLHDIGKIALPDRILEHSGRFSAEERALMEQHTIYGVELIEQRLDPMILNVVRSHHERWDGSGYPDGLAGARIPLEARIVAIADCYDALLCPQPSRRAYTMGQAMDVLEECAGNHLDPDLVELVLLHRHRWANVWLEAERG